MAALKTGGLLLSVALMAGAAGFVLSASSPASDGPASVSGSGSDSGARDSASDASGSDASGSGSADSGSGDGGSVASSAGSSDGPADAAFSLAARRILVSIDKRRLWLVEGNDTLLKAPVAIGMGKDFSWNGRKYHFATPRGQRTVIAKAKDPVWVVPEWHYYERATRMGLSEVVKLEPDSRIQLADSSWLVVQGNQVGRINHFGHFSPFTPGTEIIYDGKVYVPPLTTKQRKVPNALGPFKLDMGDGYLIHGTHPYNEESIGQAVSHGCVRMTNEDLTRLYPMVPRGTPVHIF